ncbi:MAG: cyclic-di-AMP receptor [Clostridia bacterium]|nr:cyclic-di-AMP receptor [Clostridia bacterium]
MKLIIAIVNRDDSAAVAQRLTKAGFMSTRLSTTGGFLRAGNTTLLIGTDDEKVDDVLAILGECCSKRTEIINTATGNYAEQFFTTLPVEITVGGATVFILNVENFIKM